MACCTIRRSSALSTTFPVRRTSGTGSFERSAIRSSASAEDKLRLLRAIRFGARLGYSIEPETWAAVCRMAPEIRRVSAERIREELAPYPDRRAGGNRLPSASRVGNAARDTSRRCPGTITWSVAWSAIPAKAAVDFAFGVLLHDVSPGERSLALSKISRCPDAEGQHVVSLVQSLPQFRTLPSAPVHVMKRFLRRPRIEDHLELVRICANGGRRRSGGLQLCCRKAKAMVAGGTGARSRWFPVTI